MNDEQRVVGAHRLSMELALGRSLTSATHVLHSCDNPRCVNPAHLFLGDHKANMADMVAKGRNGGGGLPGEDGAGAKLSWEQTRRLRELRAEGVSNRELAAMFGVHRTTVTRITNGETWVDQQWQPLTKGTHPNARLTWDGVRHLRRLHEQGTGVVALARMFGVHRATVARITQGKAWR